DPRRPGPVGPGLRADQLPWLVRTVHRQHAATDRHARQQHLVDAHTVAANIRAGLRPRPTLLARLPGHQDRAIAPPTAAAPSTTMKAGTRTTASATSASATHAPSAQFTMAPFTTGS